MQICQQIGCNYLLLAPEIILTITAMVVVIWDLWTKNKVQMAYVTLAGIVLALISIYPAAQDAAMQGEEFFGRMVVADSFTYFAKAVLLVIAGLVTLYSIDFVQARNPVWFSEFFGILLMATVGMSMMVSSRDLVNIYMGLELVAISSYIMAGLLRRDPRSNEAAMKYFLNGALASAVLLYGLSLLYGLTGTTHLGDMAEALRRVMQSPELVPVLIAGLIFCVGGFGFKVAAAPFHLWAPDAYEGAPTPVTGFFSVGPKGAALAAILRVFVIGLAPVADRWILLFAVLAAASMFLGNMTALVQKNIKRMMAYSSIAQAGYVLVGVAAAGVAVATQQSAAAVLYYVLAYAMMNLGMFGVITAVDNESGQSEISNFKGLALRGGLGTIYAWCSVLFFVSLIGIPPTVGFFGKLFLFRSAIAADVAWLAVLIAVNSAISVGYYYGVVRNMFFEQPDNLHPFTPAPAVTAVVAVAALGTVLFGVFADPFVTWTMAGGLLN